jgi:hypothetical protein
LSATSMSTANVISYENLACLLFVDAKIPGFQKPSAELLDELSILSGGSASLQLVRRLN